MFQLRVFSILVLHSLLGLILGYQIDQSCVDEGIETEVNDAMTSAFEMADAAHDRLTAQPRHATTLELVSKLFARDSTQAPDGAITSKTVDVFHDILANYRTPVPRGTLVHQDDLVSIFRARHLKSADSRHQIIFCNRNRLRLHDEKMQTWVDDCKSRGCSVKSHADLAVANNYLHMDGKLCRGKGLDLEGKVTLAVTVNPWMGIGEGNDPDDEQRPTQIQLCPWFVEWIGKRKFKTQKQAVKVLLAKGLIKLAGKFPFAFAQIGSFRHMAAVNAADL
jgi:hypothetical protein